LEKRTKKLLLFWTIGVVTSTVQIKEIFLLLFVHKKKVFLQVIKKVVDAGLRRHDGEKAGMGWESRFPLARE
jgi:hypothetical protein